VEGLRVRVSAVQDGVCERSNMVWSTPMPVRMTTDLKVTQANRLALGQQQSTLTEKRLLLMAIANLDTTDSSLQTRVFVRAFNDLFGGSAKANYQRLSDASRQLLGRHVWIEGDGENGWDAFQWVTSIAYRTESHGSGSYIDIEFHQRMRPFLLGLKAKFHSYQLRHVAGLQSEHAVRFYELLIHATYGGRHPHVAFEVEDLKWRLGLLTRGKRNVVDERYPEFRDFHKHVLKRAQRECNELTNLSFTYRIERQGRRAHAIAFTVKLEHPPVLADGTGAASADGGKAHGRAAAALRELGFVGNVDGVVHKHGAETVLRVVRMTHAIVRSAASNSREIRNPAGLAQRLLQEGVPASDDTAESRPAAPESPDALADELIGAFSAAREATAIAEWEAMGADERHQVRERMRSELHEIALRVIEDGGWQGAAFASLRAPFVLAERWESLPADVKDLDRFARTFEPLRAAEMMVRSEALALAKERLA